MVRNGFHRKHPLRWEIIEMCRCCPLPVASANLLAPSSAETMSPRDGDATPRARPDLPLARSLPAVYRQVNRAEILPAIPRGWTPPRALRARLTGDECAGSGDGDRFTPLGLTDLRRWNIAVAPIELPDCSFEFFQQSSFKKKKKKGKSMVLGTDLD